MQICQENSFSPHFYFSTNKPISTFVLAEIKSVIVYRRDSKMRGFDANGSLCVIASASHAKSL